MATASDHGEPEPPIVGPFPSTPFPKKSIFPRTKAHFSPTRTIRLSVHEWWGAPPCGPWTEKSNSHRLHNSPFNLLDRITFRFQRILSTPCDPFAFFVIRFKPHEQNPAEFAGMNNPRLKPTSLVCQTPCASSVRLYIACMRCKNSISNSHPFGYCEPAGSTGRMIREARQVPFGFAPPLALRESSTLEVLSRIALFCSCACRSFCSNKN
jgi:hypothetical protein